MNITPPSIYLVGDPRLSTNLNSKATTLYYQLANQLATGSLSSLSRTVDLVDGLINIRVTRDLSYNSFISGIITITTKSVSGGKKYPFYVGTFSEITHSGTTEPAYAQSLLIPGSSTTPASTTSTIPYYLNQWTKDSSGLRFSYGVNYLGHRSPTNRIYAYHDGAITQITDKVSCDDITYNGSHFCYLANDSDPWHQTEFKGFEWVNLHDPLERTLPTLNYVVTDNALMGFTSKSGSISPTKTTVTLALGGSPSISWISDKASGNTSGSLAWSSNLGECIGRLKGSISRDGKKAVGGWLFTDPTPDDTNTTYAYFAVKYTIEYSSLDVFPDVVVEIINAGSTVWG